MGAAQLAHEALHALGAAGEAVLIDQVLPDGHRIAAAAESEFDGLAVGLTSTGAGTALWRCNLLGTNSAPFVWLRWVAVGDHRRVGNHLVGRF